MRRKDREIKDQNEMIHIMEKCEVCRLALNDDGYPYILPLNFGMQLENGNIVLYFHGANDGTKYDLIARDNRASFEMDCAHELVMDESKGACSCGMKYESVVGRGMIEIVAEEEKTEALNVLMKHYHKKENFSFSPAMLARTKVFKLIVSQITGKARN